jgi:hypothetical protein
VCAGSATPNTEYPWAHPRLAGSRRPWHPTSLFALAFAAPAGAAFVPAAARRRRP